MKFLRLTLMVFVMVILFSTNSFSADKSGKIGYVNLSVLFDEYYKTKNYDVTLEGEHKDFESIRNEKIEQIKESQGKLGLLKEDKKAALEEEIEKMKTELLEFDRQKKTDLTKKRNEKIREILLEIENIVSDYAKKESYQVILNDRVLIYGDQSINLTEKILSILNANESKKK